MTSQMIYTLASSFRLNLSIDLTLFQILCSIHNTFNKFGLEINFELLKPYYRVIVTN